MGKRSYSDDERAACLAALAANAGDVPKTARECGVPYRTLKAWVDGDRHPEAVQMCNGKKEDLASAIERVASAILDSLPAKTPDAGLKDSSISFAVLIDKMQLLRGQPTEIIDAAIIARVEATAATFDAAAQRALAAEGAASRNGSAQPVDPPLAYG